MATEIIKESKIEDKRTTTTRTTSASVREFDGSLIFSISEHVVIRDNSKTLRAKPLRDYEERIGQCKWIVAEKKFTDVFNRADGYEALIAEKFGLV